jgi:ABC-type proline/glycine betaine transport system substrate-binding protein
MKRKIFFASVLFFIAIAFNSCEVLSDCKTCRQVTYIDGAWDHETEPAEYCGAILISIETMDDYVNGNIRTAWECD